MSTRVDGRSFIKASIRAVACNAPWQCHLENEIGSLEPGKLAGLVMLERDPRRIEPRKISDIWISQTWMDGKQVYGS